MAFRLDRAAEVVAELDMRSPGSDFAQPGREAAVARVRLEGRTPHYVTLFAGADVRTYRVFLGELPAGEHRLTVQRDPKWSAPGSGFELLAARIREYRPGDAYYAALAHAPVLFAREDAPARFSDVPLITYCEKLREGSADVLQYTVVFSNEDGGTSTRALMARWGRTVDIEFVYRVWPGPQGQPLRATIQTRNHREVEFDGVREGWHPLLYVITRNNMFAAEGPATIRYQLAPEVVDLAAASRELVLDEDPTLYRVAAQELQREGKLRPFGAVEGEKISDPRNYLHVEMKLENRNSAVAVLVRLEGEEIWRSSHLGRWDYAIARDGWARTTVELPPGSLAESIREIGFHCLAVPTRVNDKDLWPDGGHCRVLAVRRFFLLDAAYRPGNDAWRLPQGAEPLEIPSGQMRVFRR
ncbi:MAG: hypothetical protein RMI94_08255 [Bryobacterales bacterium]|nr:hypothetical protein [Bryobacterales bacterium]